MKLILLPLAALLLASCNTNKSSEADPAADSIRRADSIAAIQAVAETAEKARIDSLREDSIAKINLAKENIPSFKEVNSKYGQQLSSMFKSRGFEVSSTTVMCFSPEDECDVPVKFTIAKLKQGDLSCEFRQTEGGFKMTINGAPDVLAKFASDAKNYIAKLKRESPNDYWVQNYSAVQKGNTVTLTMIGD